MNAVSLTLPDETLEQIALRVAALLADQAPPLRTMATSTSAARPTSSPAQPAASTRSCRPSGSRITVTARGCCSTATSFATTSETGAVDAHDTRRKRGRHRPQLAIAMAKAAGLDASGLEDQLRRREAGEDDPERLRARIAELEAQVEQETQAAPEAPTPPTAAEHERRFAEGYRDALNRSRTPWMGEE
jgi:hypothetical protein